MTPASHCPMRSVLCVVSATLALACADCNALLGIDEYRLGPDSAPPVHAPMDGPPMDGPPMDGPPMDGPPIDGPPTERYIGYRDDLGDTFSLTANFLWTVEIMVTEEVTLDRLGFLSRSPPGAVMTLALYADDGIVPDRPGNLVVQAQGVTVEEGACEGNVAGTFLLPGKYWFAMVADAQVELGSGPPAVTRYYVNYDHSMPLPAAFPNDSASREVETALNVYLVVER